MAEIITTIRSPGGTPPLARRRASSAEVWVMTSAPASMAGKLCVVTGANSGIGLARPRDPDHRRPNGTLDPPTSSSTLVVVSLSSSVATHRRLHVTRLLLRPHRRKSRASSRPGARASSWRAVLPVQIMLAVLCALLCARVWED